jgi:hypothetical protein
MAFLRRALAIYAVTMICGGASAQAVPLVPRPPMDWNTWSHFRTNVDAWGSTPEGMVFVIYLSFSRSLFSPWGAISSQFRFRERSAAQLARRTLRLRHSMAHEGCSEVSNSVLD